MKKLFSGGKKKEEKSDKKDSPSAAPASHTAKPAASSNSDRALDIGGMLLVRVVRGKELKTSATGSPDSLKIYCVIECDQNEIVVDSTDNEITNPVWKHRAHFDVSRSDEDVIISVVCKNIATSEETYIGMCRVQNNYEDGNIVDGSYPLLDDEDQKVGELQVQIAYKKPEQNKKLRVEDFDLLKVLGKGSFGKVMQVRKIDTGRIYAMKIIRKANIVERDEIEHTIAERNVLAKIKHPFIVNLKFSFQSPEKLYLVLAFVNGGELFKHLQDEGSFEEYRAKFYTAELLLALEHLHKFDIIYRDLKPENILLDYSGHIALCDFGLCKLHMTGDEKTNTFCGTPEYLAPELLIGEGYTKTVDWWTLGVLLYEMLTGLPPFYSENTNDMYRKILHEELTFPPEVSPLARAMLTKLLEKNPDKRLGNTGAQDIKNDPFFHDINWGKLYNREINPPFRPQVKSATDTSNFDEEFTSLAPTDSLVEDSQISESVQQKFEGFTYVATNNMTYAQTPSLSTLRP